MSLKTGKNALALALALAVSFGLSGCITSPSPISDSAGNPAAARVVAGSDPFSEAFRGDTVHSKDKLSVRVLREAELSAPEIRVGEDGFIDLPYVGRIQADGRTTQEIGDEIRDKLGRTYLRNPHVSVNVIDYASYLVTVEGSIAQPGVYQIQPDTTLIGALAMARGPDRNAKLSQVAIFRTVGGEKSVAVFDVAQVRSGAMVNPVLMPGDRIQVGFDALSQIWQDFLRTAPAIGVFQRF